MPEADPLILTAALDPATAALLQRLRDRHFPARLNIVPAHLTLFHHLPGTSLATVVATLRAACSDMAPLPVASGALRFLGRGVAIGLEAPGLVALRGRLATDWRDWLTPQDRQGFRPHVTIQNKADPAAARALLARLQAEGIAIAGTAVGLDLWHYRGGPWEAAGHVAFGGAAAAEARP